MTCIIRGCGKETTPFTYPCCSDEHYGEASRSGLIFQRRVVQDGPVDLVTGLPMESDAELRARIKGRLP